MKSLAIFIPVVVFPLLFCTDTKPLTAVVNAREQPIQAVKPYTEKITGTDLAFEMVAVPAGAAIIGSPEDEKERLVNEGPLHVADLDAFWIGKHEVTWDLFEYFVNYKDVDAVTGPTPPFTDMSFGMGKSGFPAVNMTNHAAMNYCRWLTKVTGHFYRLPTEAEWEYACRAGTKTAYSFGDDPAHLAEYAWYSKNSDEKYQKVGLKKPNNWGIHDMHGNVAEWTLDQFSPKFYASPAARKKNPWLEPTALYPHSVRGGSWDDDPDDLRSAARRGSDKSWKRRDPQMPKSNWWLTDASFVGFRVVRPLKQPSAAEISRYFKKAIPDL